MKHPLNLLRRAGALWLLFLAACTEAVMPDPPSPATARPAVADYRAELVTTVKGVTGSARLLVRADRVRVETDGARRSSIMIARFDRARLWLLVPAMNRYAELPLDAMNDLLPPFFEPGLTIVRQRLGTETLDGRPVVKSAVRVVRRNGREYRGTLWEEPAFAACPVKWQDAGGEVTAEWREVAVAPLPDVLFEIPVGYQPLPQQAAEARRRGGD